MKGSNSMISNYGNEREQIIYRKDKLELVNDYTKNISQAIFSPGVLPSNKFIERQNAAQKLRNQVNGGSHKKQGTSNFALPKNLQRPRTSGSAGTRMSAKNQLDNFARALN